ncbi:MAG: outer membrane beta-barrel protein [Gallionellaceae bacterium]
MITKKRAVLQAIILFAASVNLAHAQAQNGFGLNIGLASHSMEGTVAPSNFPISYTSSGMSLGLDYQFAISDSFSVNPFLMSSSESVSGDLNSGTTTGHGIFGLQARYWIGDLFVGAHVASYSEVLLNSSNSARDTAGAGTGGGLVVGWEPSRWSVTGQIDSPNLTYSDADIKLTGIRVNVGYRWK